uniref:Transcription cofactor vestigial-like protein 4 n=1 Tax=Anopheles atroparvus TaxID=41427 RepID=A0A182IQZ9_ANOAO
LKKLVQTRLKMIRDPGGSSPNENLDSPPSPKYDRIGMLGRPPPLDDTEIPLDMTVRRKDSSDGQGSPTGGDPSRDVPINLNVRPSVITKAPPPPIKKRISHMHTNGEIVLKSSVRTSSSSAVDSKPIVHVSSTYCDVSIEEHFRRSLGPTYSSIYGDKQPLQQQQPSATALNVLNNNISTGHGSSFPSYDHQAKHPLPHQAALLLQHPAPPISPASMTTTGSLASSSPSSSLASSPAPFLTLHPHQQQHAYQHQHQQQLKGNHDSGGEVDDHFAKALGDTWKKIQENKMNL